MPFETTLPVGLESGDQAGKAQFDHNAKRSPFTLDLVPNPTFAALDPGDPIEDAEVSGSQLLLTGDGSYQTIYSKDIPSGVLNEVGEGIDFAIDLTDISDTSGAGTWKFKVVLVGGESSPSTIFEMDFSATDRPSNIRVLGSLVFSTYRQIAPFEETFPRLTSSFGLLWRNNVDNVDLTTAFGTFAANPTNRVIGGGASDQPDTLSIEFHADVPNTETLKFCQAMRFHPQQLASLE